MAKLVPGVNDLATLYPEVAQEADDWDPSTVTSGSSGKKSWRCPKGHTYEASVCKRTPPERQGCPFCAGRQALAGFNDLETLCPKVAAEAKGWDPSTLTLGSHKLLLWQCEKGHTWKARVKERTPPRNCGCPYCSGNKVLAGFNDLETYFPKVAKEADGWDPKTVTPGSQKRLPWRCKEGHKWEATVLNRTPPSNSGCPYCSGRKPVPGVNDLATVYPDLAKQADGWDPSEVLPKSGEKLPWRCLKGHRWSTTVATRTPPQQSGCPVCSGKKVLEGFNDLATLLPEVAKEAQGWDPKTVTPGSAKTLLWRCDKDHTWTTQVKNRTPPTSSGCPFCTNKKVLAGFNDLCTLFPEVAKEADGWDPRTVTPGSTKKLVWKCKKGHNWKAVVGSRTPPAESGCPFCSGRQVLAGFNDLATLCPQVAAEADGWDPATVTLNSGLKKAWCCSKGHTWTAQVTSRTPPTNTSCPFCAGKQTLAGFNDLATLFPEVAKEADGWDPRTVTPGANKKLAWKCDKGHNWQAVVNDRTPPYNSKCPVCAGKQVLAGFNDLATLCPQVAAEADGWDPTTVTASSGLRKAWCCDKGHKWKAVVSDRTPPSSNGCPDCAETGFKPSLPAWFYLLQRPGEQQLGVTNYLDNRLRYHAKRGWSEVEVVGPCPGEAVLTTEKSFKRWLRTAVGLVPGTHENWFTAKLEVQSLAELKAKSGVETELF